MKVFAENFRGFKYVEIDLDKINFLVGDNSCGKSSLIYLAEVVAVNDLTEIPSFEDHFALDAYDYFSPYLNYADVVFGYHGEDSSGFTKIITVRRREGKRPEITRCSYFLQNAFVTFLSDADGPLIFEGMINSQDRGAILEAHHADHEFKSTGLDKSVRIEQPLVFLLLGHESSREHLKEYFRAAVDNVFKPPRIVSPLRAMPEKYYTFRRKIGTHGEHFAPMWFDFSQVTESGDFEQINAFGKESGLFEQVRVEKIAIDIEDSPLIVTVTQADQKFLLNQVGIGVSQVVPVLIDTIYCLRFEHIILMQQPELHLHPIAQAALGSYLAKCCSRGLRAVIETHSSYLIDRFRSEMRDIKNANIGKTEENSPEVEIIFCERGPLGNSSTHIAINENGQLVNAPENYHKFFVEELIRTMV